MKHLFHFFLFLVFTPFFNFAQSLTFNRIYPTAEYSDIREVVAAPGGCFVFTGLTEDGPDSLGDIYLTKINAAGAVVWSHTYSRTQEDGGNAILATRDGGYLLAGHTALSYGDKCDGYLLKTDANGQEQWRSFIGGTFDDVCNSTVEMPDGSFLTTGRTENAGDRHFRVMLAKTAANGTSVFLKEGEDPINKRHCGS